MTKTYMMGAFLALVVGVFAASCGIQSAVNEINEAAEEAAKQARAQAGFEKAVSTVTEKVLTQALTYASGATAAPAPAFSAAGEIHTSETVDATAAVDGGGSISVKGTIKLDGSYPDDFVGTTTITETLDLAVTWTGLKIKTDDGQELTSDGNITMAGTLTVTTVITAAGALESFTISGELTEKGTFTLDGESYTLDVKVTISQSGNTITTSYTGTLNGKPVSGSESQTFDPYGQNDDGNNNNNNNTGTGKACNMSESYVCTEYNGSYWTDEVVAGNCAMGTQQASCSSTSRIGRCTSSAGTSYESVIHYYTGYAAGDPATSCTDGGGTWAAN